eukprot:COSAG04_NODE_31147_length_258_cov_0.955975_2_plen_41_part_01
MEKAVARSARNFERGPAKLKAPLCDIAPHGSFWLILFVASR